MTQRSTNVDAADPERLHARILALGREALEGSRPMSDLFGEALVELREALELIRSQQAELRARPPDGCRPPAGTEESTPSLNGGSADEAPGDCPGRISPLYDLRLWEDAPESANGHDPVDLELPTETDAAALGAALRARIAGGLYVGSLRPGARLPGIREIARRTGLNHKVVRRIYRSLERSGFVDVRDRSGIYVAAPAAPRDDPEELGAWVTDVVEQALRRGLRATDLPPTFQRAVAARSLRCACVESTEDDRFALCHEIGQRFGVTLVPTEPGPGLESALRQVHMAVTTPFHADEVTRAMPGGRPVIVTTVHAGVRAVARHCLERGGLNLVCVDPCAGDRLRSLLGAEAQRRARVVTVDRLTPSHLDGSGAPGMATLAAWDRVRKVGTSAALRVPPYLSMSASRAIAEAVVRLNLAAGDG